MALTLSLHTPPAVPVEVDTLLPSELGSLSIEEIERLPIIHGNRSVPVGEFFTVSGSIDDGSIIFQGNCRKVHRIGERLDGGTINVEGDAGDHIGNRMRAGRIDVSGSVGKWAGAELRDGTLHVRGNAGNHLGAAYRGSRRGMRGGFVIVNGDVGEEIGQTLRRGVIVVGGSAGPSAGQNLIAGSIFLFGQSEPPLGTGMRRGSIVQFAPSAKEAWATEPSASFRREMTESPVWLRFFLRQLRELGFPVLEQLEPARYHRWVGDVLAGGRGEILAREVE